MNVVATPEAIARVAALPDDECAAVRAAIRALPSFFGRPHLHSGFSLRKLDATHYEIRAGLTLRVVFKHEGQTLAVQLIGTHDEVRAFLKNRR